MGTTNEEYVHQILRAMKKMDYIKPDEIPNIELYMDQVTTFMDEHLKSARRSEDDKMLTKTMINNYTKNSLLPSPNKKKYSKEHMLLLIFIYYFKSFLSIGDIQSILAPLTDRFFEEKSKISLEDIYQEVFSLEKEQVDLITKDIIRKFTKAEQTFPDLETGEDREFLTTFSFICLLSFDVYAKKMLIEKLIDERLTQFGKGKETHKKETAPPSKNTAVKEKEKKEAGK